ncbi:NUDIX domain-containing protein [Roseomonas ludipueritiae]|uniref:GDP-mannose pyrophosphatase n=2 Tax=Pseudoroseomonas ludipueritiae TaxID=198093 RepID=A0ABR7R6I9_9PROT|nr:NUDIX domain-containing protein [Pseudoroseomonas ludipueritiae]
MVATIRLPDGQLTKRDIEDHGEAAVVLPYDPARRVAMLVRQFRTPPYHVSGDGMMLEPAAGRLDEADPESCARREALEEVGLRLTSLEPVACVWTMPALSTERAWLYLAPYAEADRVAKGGGLVEEHEEIEVLEVPLVELAAMADAGTLTEIKLLLLVQTLRLRQPALFT